MKKTNVVGIVGDPKNFGYGHLRRMQILKKYLSYENISLEILITNEYWADVPPCSVLLLDRRDSAFPPAAKKKAKKLIAFDNQGQGAREAHISLHLLPNTKMNPKEFRESLAYIILPEKISQRKNLCFKAKIHFSPQRHPPRAKLQLFAKHKRTLEHFFRQNLIKSHSFSCYFGQSFFEALYLGKEIFLYSLTPTHRALSLHFLKNWLALKNPQFYFDGKGAQRLSQLIKQLVLDE